MEVILVVDGKANPIKASVDIKRRDDRGKQVERLKAFMTTGAAEGGKKLKGLAKDACHVTREVVAYFLQWANENSVVLIGAPMEAEHQLVFMQNEGEIEWIYTVDSDELPHCATNVIYEVKWDRGNFTLWSFTHDLVTKFFEEVMKKEGSFRRDDFVAHCIFLGCDYCDRIPGVGPVALNESFKTVWADKSADNKLAFLVNLAEYGRYTFKAAMQGSDTVAGKEPVPGYGACFSEAFAGLTSPVPRRGVDDTPGGGDT
jgi:flap endonuclease-1